MNIGMIVNNINVQTTNSKSLDEAATNRTNFLEMLQGITMTNDREETSQLMVNDQNNAQSLLSIDVATEEERTSLANEVEELLNLLPDYLRAEIAQLLQQNVINDQEFIAEKLTSSLTGEQDLNIEEILFNLKMGDLNLNFSEENVTLAQMFASFIQVLQRLQNDRQSAMQQPLEKMRAMLHDAVKAEAQLTGLNASEILSKLDKLMNSSNQVKSNYLQEVVGRLYQPMKQGEQQTGLNMTTVLDSSQAMSRVQQFVIHIGDQPTKEAEQRQFIRQFQDIIGKGLLRQLNNGTTQFTIKLHPQHLGRLDIQFLQTNGLITAKITASTNAAREMIEAQLQQLRNTFVQQQINVERIEVTQQQAYQLNKDGEGKQRQDDGRKSKQKEEQQNEESFASLLDEITFNEKV